MKIFIHEKSEFIKITGANRPIFEEIKIQKRFCSGQNNSFTQIAYKRPLWFNFSNLFSFRSTILIYEGFF